jgi:hypothetical protein
MATNIPERIAEQAEAARTFIDGKWTFSTEKANQAFDTAVDAITAIAATGLPSITVPSFDWDDISVDFSVSLVKPSLPDITFNWPTTKPVMGTLQEYPAIAFPISAFNQLNGEVIAAIRLKLETGGTGLGAAAEAALWTRNDGA